MHISEGVLSPALIWAGLAVSGLGVAYGLRKLPWLKVMPAGILSAAFFVASLVHIPIGPGSAHLLLTGLLGACLGWAAFPCIAVALLLQAILFQFGGIAVLGVNTFIMALPAALVGTVLRPYFIQSSLSSRWQSFWIFICGATPVLFTAGLGALVLTASGTEFRTLALALLVAHIPVAVIEGCVTLGVVSLVNKVQPELFAGAL